MPEQKLNPEALEPLYGLAKLCIRYLNRDDYPETVSRLRTAIALAESTPEQQSPSGAMTMERAMEIAKCYACLGLDALTSLGPADLAAEFIRIDRAVRIKTLEWIRDHVLINDRADDGPMHVAIKRRLTEIRKEHR